MSGSPEPVEARSSFARRTGVALTLLLLLVGIAAGGVWWLLQAPEDESRPVEVEIMPGWGAARVAAELRELGLVQSARAFALYMRWQDIDRVLGEGLYDLDAAYTAAETAAVLREPGRPRITRVVIPEGFRASDVVDRLVDAGFGAEEDYTLLANAVSASEREWLQPAPAPEGFERPLLNFEGYLFPASYDIPTRSSPEQVIALFLNRFELELPGAEQILEELGLSIRDWVILASLVQSEAGNDEEMPVIAGVFLNRLEAGMPMQSDPTVAYGLGKALPELSVSAGDMQADHPWNTYVYPELPAGPISNPGHDALQAVLQPERTNEAGQQWFYFLHGTDAGEPVFRPNPDYDSHLRDIARYLR